MMVRGLLLIDRLLKYCNIYTYIYHVVCLFLLTLTSRGLFLVFSQPIYYFIFNRSVCGTGWLVFRQREDLAEHVAITVTYLGGHCDSMTLNFSRPASGVYVQYYKLVCTV
jgi:hypothetical protein